MDKLPMLGMLAALGLASAAYAQYQPPPDTQSTPQSTPQTSQSPDSSEPSKSPDPDAASSPHQRDVTGQSETQETRPTESPESSAASTPHQRGAVGKEGGASEGMAGKAGSSKVVGLQVESTTGQSLGTVSDVVADSGGQPAYAMISTGTDTMTAVPYDAVRSMMSGDKIVMDRTLLENSPQVSRNEMKDKSDTSWKTEADRYWSSSIRSASPGNEEPPARR